MRRYAWLLLAVACNSGTLPLSSSMQAESCLPDEMLPPGGQIVACGFSPHLELMGVDGDAVYAATVGGQLYRVEKRTGQKTLLYTEPSPAVYGQGRGLHLAGGHLYFLSEGALFSLATAAPSSPVQVLAVADFDGDPVITEDGIYWLHTQKEPGSVTYLDVRRTPLDGGQNSVVLPNYAVPVAAAAGFLYLTTLVDGSAIFPPFPQLLRVPTAGGTASVAVAEVDPAGRSNTSGEGTIAAGADGVYLLKNLDPSQNRYPILHYPMGGDGQVIGTAQGPNSEVPAGVPFALRLDGSNLYFLSASQPGATWDAGVTLMRLQAGTPVAVYAAQSLGVPAFDDSSIYVTYQRGGITTPIEGVVARIPK